jgi:branched-subunit amino acid transport protein
MSTKTEKIQNTKGAYVTVLVPFAIITALTAIIVTKLFAKNHLEPTVDISNLFDSTDATFGIL